VILEASSQCFIIFSVLRFQMYDSKVVLFVNDCTYDIFMTKSFYDCMFIILLVLSCIVLTFSISDGCTSVDRQKLNKVTSYKLVWGQSPKALTRRIFILQKRAVRYNTKLKHLESCRDSFRHLDINSVLVIHTKNNQSYM
jgi:hypothetical protein